MAKVNAKPATAPKPTQTLKPVPAAAAQQSQHKADKDQPNKVDATTYGAGSVTVACAVPVGLILRLQTLVTREQMGQGGEVRKIKEFVELDPRNRVRLNGPAFPKGQIPPYKIIGGKYALTTGVPLKFWEEWLEQNKNTDMVRNRQVFMHAKEGDAYAEAKELAKSPEHTSNLDQLAPVMDPRRPQSPKQNGLDGEKLEIVPANKN